MTRIAWLDATLHFPETRLALREPNGLLAAGGDLRPERLLAAYRRGIFPWYSSGQPILWWSPSPRMVLRPAELQLNRSTRKLLKRHPFEIRSDSCFETVIEACARVPRPGQDGTWINEEMRAAYRELHRLGHAHSVETWLGGELVGGLYGIAIGCAFFGESMFSLVSDASRVAFVTLVQQLAQRGFQLIDCQIYTDYLASFGARELSREVFETLLADATASVPAGSWQDHWQSGDRPHD